MKLRRVSIILLFRVLWVILATGLMLFVIAKNIYTARQLVYQVDFEDSSSADYRGWYPASRLHYDPDDQKLYILGEPVYMKVYLPSQFDVMSIQGSWSLASTTVRLGLKQADDSWFYKDIDQATWSGNFDLSQAKIYRHQIELMIAIPGYQSDQNIYLDNNWQIKFTK